MVSKTQYAKLASFSSNAYHYHQYRHQPHLHNGFRIGNIASPYAHSHMMLAGPKQRPQRQLISSAATTAQHQSLRMPQCTSAVRLPPRPCTLTLSGLTASQPLLVGLNLQPRPGFFTAEDAAPGRCCVTVVRLAIRAGCSSSPASQCGRYEAFFLLDGAEVSQPPSADSLSTLSPRASRARGLPPQSLHSARR